MFFKYLSRSLSQYNVKSFYGDLSRWGTAIELERYKNFLVAKRRKEWLLGRLTSKELVQDFLLEKYDKKVAFEHISIQNAPCGQPYFEIVGSPELNSSSMLSISHSKDLSFCAIASVSDNEAIGVDLEYISPRSESFIETFFTEMERETLLKFKDNHYDKAVTMIWSIKEAVLKALSIGLCVDTRKINVSLSDISSSWVEQKVEADLAGIRELRVATCCLGSYVFSGAHLKKQQQLGKVKISA